MTIPEFVYTELWALFPTAIFFMMGLFLYGFAIWVTEKATPFSVRREIIEGHNAALGILIGCGLVGLAIILAAAIKG